MTNYSGKLPAQSSSITPHASQPALVDWAETDDDGRRIRSGTPRIIARYHRPCRTATCERLASPGRPARFSLATRKSSKRSNVAEAPAVQLDERGTCHARSHDGKTNFSPSSARIARNICWRFERPGRCQRSRWPGRSRPRFRPLRRLFESRGPTGRCARAGRAGRARPPAFRLDAAENSFHPATGPSSAPDEALRRGQFGVVLVAGRTRHPPGLRSSQGSVPHRTALRQNAVPDPRREKSWPPPGATACGFRSI